MRVRAMARERESNDEGEKAGKVVGVGAGGRLKGGGWKLGFGGYLLPLSPGGPPPQSGRLLQRREPPPVAAAP